MAEAVTSIKVICVLFILGNFFKENEVMGNGSISIPVPDHARIQAQSGRKCLNFLWDSPCDHPYCKVTLKIKVEKDSNSVTEEIKSYKPDVTKNGGSYVQCLYDSSAGETFTCCNTISAGVQVTSGHQVSFSVFEKLSFHVMVCINESGNCVSRPYWYKFILPWYDPCFFNKPCQNYGTCNSTVNSYSCSCTSSWKGDNCTIPEDMTYTPGMCLKDSSKTDELYNKTVGECRDACFNKGSSMCKSFEFKKMPSGNHGNCILRDSNNLEHKLVSCDADLYEITRYLSPAGGSTAIVVTVPLLVLMILVDFFLAE